jgi:hypothetical protein
MGLNSMFPSESASSADHTGEKERNESGKERFRTGRQTFSYLENWAGRGRKGDIVIDQYGAHWVNEGKFLDPSIFDNADL